MGAPYAQELRDRVLAAYDRGMKTKQVADVFEVSPAWARRVKQHRRETGETTPRPMGGATVIKIDLAQLAELVRQRPDAAIQELRVRFVEPQTRPPRKIPKARREHLHVARRHDADGKPQRSKMMSSQNTNGERSVVVCFVVALVDADGGVLRHSVKRVSSLSKRLTRLARECPSVARRIEICDAEHRNESACVPVHNAARVAAEHVSRE